MHTSNKNINLNPEHQFKNDKVNYYRELSEKIKLILEASLDAIVGISIHGRVILWNSKAQGIFGWKKEEVIGRPVHDIITKQSHTQLDKVLKDHLETHNKQQQNHSFKAIAINRSNQEFPVLISMVLIQDEGQAIYCLFIRDRTDHTNTLDYQDQNTIENHYYRRQQEATSAIIRAQEIERSIIGQELHDNINQILTTVKLYNEMLLDGIGEPKEIIKKSVHHLQNCINEIRSISKRLSAPTLGKISLQDTLKEMIESINLTKRINIVYTIDGFSSADTPQEVHLGLYRIVQEHLNNISNYSESSFASITISRKQKQLILIIQDDGNGMEMLNKRNNIGVINMKTRAENLNGSFTLSSEQGKGCRLEVIIPLQ